MTAVVNVDSVTRLETISETDGVTKYHEVYQGFKTGNIFEYPSNVPEDELRQAYNAKLAADEAATVKA